MSKKKILSLALVAIMVATLSFGTLAWFSDSDDVTNYFQVATSDGVGGDADDIFSVDVWEYVDTDGNGTIDDADKDQDGLTFNNILPAGRYHKEPYVENTGAYDQWVRVKVTVSCASVFQSRLGKDYDLSKIFEGHDEQSWTRNAAEDYYDATNDTLTYTYYLGYRLEPDEYAVLFNTVVMPEELTQEDMAAMGGSFSLKIVAEAVQAEHTGDNAVEAFATVTAAQDIG